MSHPVPTRMYCYNAELHDKEMIKLMHELKHAAMKNVNQSWEEREKAIKKADDFLIRSEDHLDQCTEAGEYY